ncbi:hypothetical protein PG985_011193 [Apiospora marii]|uniref:uncharacterized protein n=1 Tax=Apiospora marii TaxID=335849 RepID=UPI0031317F13
MSHSGMSNRSSSPDDSNDSQEKTYSNDEHASDERNNTSRGAATDDSESDYPSAWLSVYDWDPSLDLAERPEPVDTSLEHFNILRPIETPQRTSHILPWPIAAPDAAPEQAPFPGPSKPVLSLESPVLGSVHINKDCFALILLHCDRNQQLERELAELRRERRDLDAELLCRGDDIAYYKKEIESLREARRD